MALKLVIFDCDGVLFDSRRSNTAYYNKFAEMFGRPSLTEEQIVYIQAHTVFESIDHVFGDDPEMVQKILELRSGVDYRPFLKLLDPEPGLLDCLARLKESYTLAMLTNRSDTLNALVETHRLDRYFSQIIGCLDVEKPKPDPEGAFRLMKINSCRAEECVYIGDTMTDVLTARAAEIPFIAYKSPELEAWRHLSHFDDLPVMLRDREGEPRAE